MIFIAKVGTERRGYNTLKKAIIESPELFFGEGEYIPIYVCAPTANTPFYSVKYKFTNETFPEGTFQALIDFSPVEMEGDNNSELSTEDIDYIKGLQS